MTNFACEPRVHACSGSGNETWDAQESNLLDGIIQSIGNIVFLVFTL